jgi:hypothetical protein
MKKLLLASTMLAWSGMAMAADLPVKAPIAGFPTTGCGLYYGINALGSATPIKDATPGATAIGGDVGLSVGYTCAVNAQASWFVESMADFQNLNASGPGFSLTGPAHFEQRGGFSGPILSLLPALPNLNFPAVPSLPILPAGITAVGPSQAYIFAGLSEDDVSARFGGATAKQWIVSPEAGLGMRTRLSNNVVADVWAAALLQSQEICIGVMACPKMATGFRTGLGFYY